MLRYVTPVMNFRRTATCDLELSGTADQGGRQGRLLPHRRPTATRTSSTDPTSSTSARDPNPHIAFGGGGPALLPGGQPGPHGDPGDVRATCSTACPTSTRPATCQRLQSQFINGVKHLPVAFTPARRRGQARPDVARRSPDAARKRSSATSAGTRSSTWPAGSSGSGAPPRSRWTRSPPRPAWPARRSTSTSPTVTSCSGPASSACTSSSRTASSAPGSDGADPAPAAAGRGPGPARADRREPGLLPPGRGHPGHRPPARGRGARRRAAHHRARMARMLEDLVGQGVPAG